MDMQSGRSLPKNFRQIGSAEKSTKVYIEDYVYTFMRKLSAEGEISVGALIGNNVMREGVECVFISGMVKAAGYTAGNGRISITDDTWAAVFENVKSYFEGMTVCGWFISGQDAAFLRQPVISGINNSGNYDAALVYIRDKENDEDCVYKVTSQGKDRLSGYYIYYERNEQMQDYMIDTSGTSSVDPPPVNIMNRLKSNDSNAEEGQTTPIVTVVPDKPPVKSEGNSKKGSRAIYAAASLLIVSFVVLGASVYQNGAEGMFGKIKAAVASVPINASENESQPESETAIPSGIVIENAPGIVENTSAESFAENETGVQAETVNAVENTTEPSDLQESAAESSVQTSDVPESGLAEGAASVTESPADGPQSTQAAEISATPGSSYVVQAGDTLTSICIKVYGKEDVKKIEEIKDVNNLENADYIFVGQVISIP